MMTTIKTQWIKFSAEAKRWLIFWVFEWSGLDFWDHGKDTSASFVGVRVSGLDLCEFVFLVEVFNRGVHGVRGLLLGFSLTGTGFVNASSHEFSNEICVEKEEINIQISISNKFIWFNRLKFQVSIKIILPYHFFKYSPLNIFFFYWFFSWNLSNFPLSEIYPNLILSLPP